MMKAELLAAKKQASAFLTRLRKATNNKKLLEKIIKEQERLVIFYTRQMDLKHPEPLPKKKVRKKTAKKKAAKKFKPLPMPKINKDFPVPDRLGSEWSRTDRHP